MYRILIPAIIVLLSAWLLGCQTPAATSTQVPPKPAATAAAPTAPSPAVTAPTATPAPQVQKGGTLRLAVRCNPGSLHVFKGPFCILPGYLLYDSLLGFDEKGNLYPELAEKWDVSPDGKAITFKLRPGVKFHDGTDFNAAAVKFNMEAMISEKGQLVADFADVESINVVDNLTVRVNMKAISAPFLTAMAEQAGFIASPTAMEKYGVNKDYGRNPAGAGPFQLEEWVQDDHVTFKRFEQYWDSGKPYLDRVIFRIIPDASVRTINLRSGTVDWIAEVAPKDVAGLKGSKDFLVYEMLSTGFWRLPMQMTKPPFDNKALRQAVAYALNMEPVVKSIFYGYTEVATSPLNRLSWGYDPDYKGVPYDLSKAKAKLTEGGKPNGFEVSLTSYSTEDYAPVIEAVQAQLKEVGIKVVPKLGLPATTTPTIVDGNFEMAITQWTGKLDPDAVHGMFHSKGGYNFAKYSNPKVDELLDRARQTFDQKERKRHYGEAIPIIMEDASRPVLFYAPVLAASTDKVQNYKLMPGWYFQFETFKTVWLKR